MLLFRFRSKAAFRNPVYVGNNRKNLVPEARIELARLAAGDFLTASAFAAVAWQATFVVWSTPSP